MRANDRVRSPTAQPRSGKHTLSFCIGAQVMKSAQKHPCATRQHSQLLSSQDLQGRKGSRPNACQSGVAPHEGGRLLAAAALGAAGATVPPLLCGRQCSA